MGRLVHNIFTCISVFKWIKKRKRVLKVTWQWRVRMNMGLSQSWSYLEKVCRPPGAVNLTLTRLSSYTGRHSPDLWATGGCGCADWGTQGCRTRRSGIPTRTRTAKCWCSTCGASPSSSGWRWSWTDSGRGRSRERTSAAETLWLSPRSPKESPRPTREVPLSDRCPRGKAKGKRTCPSWAGF